MTISASKLWLIHGFNQNTSVWWRKTFAAGASAGNTGVPGIRSGLKKQNKKGEQGVRTEEEDSSVVASTWLRPLSIPQSCWRESEPQTFRRCLSPHKVLTKVSICPALGSPASLASFQKSSQCCCPPFLSVTSAQLLVSEGKIFFNDKASLNLYSHRCHSPESLKPNLWLVNKAVRHRIIFNRGAVISQISFAGLIHQIKSCLICRSESELV